MRTCSLKEMVKAKVRERLTYKSDKMTIETGNTCQEID